LGILPEDIVLLNVGRFSYAKGQRFTIESFAQLRKEFSNLKLVLVGEGECLSECRRFSHELDVAGSVIFVGFSNNVPLFYALGDIFVITSLREGLPRVVVEASLSRLPSVGFEVEGIGEIISDEESGFIVRPYDVVGLTAKTRILITDPELRAKFAERAFQHARAGWDYRIMIDRLRRLYLRRNAVNA
jgi:glycosyltransferase involved in cell wall biosynthesis